MTAPEQQPPMTPATCDLRDFAFMPLDVVRLFSSEFHATATDAEWRAGVTLWCKAWHQVPAASLPDNDVALARLAEFGRDLVSWEAVKAKALHGWVKSADGRLYHPVVAGRALEAWIEKLGQRKSSAAGNAKRWKLAFDPADLNAAIRNAAGMLSAIAPQSRTLHKRTAREASGQSTPEGSPDDTPDGNAGGTPEDIPSGSQETGTGTGTGNLKEEEPLLRNGGSAAGQDTANAGKPDWWPKRDRYGRVIGELTDKVVFDVGKAVLGKNAGGQIQKLLKLYRHDLRAVTDFLLQAEEKSAPREWFAGVLKRAEMDEPDNPRHVIYPEREYRA